MLSSKRKIGVYVISSALALGLYFLLFELRYAWYLNANDVAFIRICNIAFMLGIVGLWIFFPSPILVAVVAILGLLFPPLYNSDKFAIVNLPFVAVSSLSIGFLIVVTLLWRNARN